MGLGDFVKGIGDAVVNVGKGAAFVADPHHWDDIAEGAGKAVEFVAKNPGKTWDTAFEVGRAIAKDQMDPMNLAINAGLLAATVATGGAAAPALVAKLGLGAKSISAGITAAKGVDAGMDIVKGVKTASSAFKAGRTALKAADTVGDVAKGVRTTAKALDAADTAGDVGRNLSRGQRFMQDAKQITTGIKESKGLERVDNVLNAGQELRGAGREALGMSRYGKVAETRAGWAQKALGTGDEVGGIRKYAARQIGGETNPLLNPKATTSFSRASSRVNRAQNKASAVFGADEKVENAAEAVEFAADPKKAIMDRAIKEADKRGVGQSTGYVDHGQTTENLYQQSEETSQAAGSAGRGMHYWEGPRSQWAGGISSGYDWRKIDPLRPIRSGPKPGSRNVTKSGEVEDETPQGDQYMGKEQNDFGGKEQNDFGPEMSKGGNLAGSQGSEQRALGAGPTVRTGEASRSRHNVTNARTVKRPIGAIGTGSAKSSGVIDVDSSSPEDYKFDSKGQGYFDFANMGSGTADIGQQPNTSPMYRSGSRTSSRRPAGMLGA